MKKLLLFTVSLVLILGCGDSKEQKQEKDVKEVLSKVSKPVGPILKLQYKFRKGDKFSYKLETNSHTIEEIIADTTLTNEIKQNAKYTFDFVVKGVDEYKTAELEVKIRSIVAETNYNGESLKYDSKFIYSSRERSQFVDYESVKKVPFRIRVSEIGQVVQVDRINKIMNNILNIQNVPDTLSTETKERMRSNIANGTLIPLTQQIFKVVSENEVGIDSVWQLKYTTPLAVFSVENTAIFKVNDILTDQDTTTSISSSLLINVMGNNVVNENGMKYTFSQPQLNANGTIRYNSTKGLVELSESNTELEIGMVVEGFDSNNNNIKSTKRDKSTNSNIVELL